MHVTEYQPHHIEAIIRDMRTEAAAKRHAAVHVLDPVAKSSLQTDANIIDHWCNQLEAAIIGLPKALR